MKIAKGRWYIIYNGCSLNWQLCASRSASWRPEIWKAQTKGIRVFRIAFAWWRTMEFEVVDALSCNRLVAMFANAAEASKFAELYQGYIVRKI